MVKTTNDLAAFKKDVLPSLVEFIDDVMTDAEWIKVREHQKTVQKLNYRVDRQGPPIKNPLRYRHAIQIQADAKDPSLKLLTRSKGPNGGKFNKSYPTVAQVEIECDSCISASKLREAFYASMIPEDKYLRLGYLHKVMVHKNGTFDVTMNQKWKDAEGL